MIETIPALLRDAARRLPDAPALVPPTGAPLSFAGLDALADRFARGLLHDGMAAGARLAVWLPNRIEWVAAAVGAQRVGGVLVPLYFRYQASEVAAILERAGASHLVCSGALAAQLRGRAPAALARVIVIDGEAGGAGEIGWDAFLDAGDGVGAAALAAREAAVTGDDVSDIMFTSGTTGRPKGAVFTHRSGVAAARIMQDYNRVGEADCFCPMGTFAHVGGYKQGWVTGLASGCAVAWGDAHDAASVLDLVARLGITVMPAAPITWAGVLDYAERARFDISRLRLAATGGTMVPEELVHRLVDELGLAQVGTGYGMTESCGLAAYTRPDDPPAKVAQTVGRAAPDVAIRIVDGDGGECAAGATGEIMLRTPRLLTGYLDDAAATAAALSGDGWFATGDVGCLDEAGYLRITDRLKDMYIINGLNVYPAEIERVIGGFPGVAQVAVIGVAEPVKGEVGAAFIVPAAGAAPNEAAIAALCREQLAGYKVPKYINLVDDLPRNAMGKVLKNELRDMRIADGKVTTA